MSAAPWHPEQAAVRSWRLPVTGGHDLQVREWGAASGIPALVLHGGPGSGCSPLLARFFDPARYRVLCMDQRGAGASRPAGGVSCNTTAELLADLRRLRRETGVQRWLVVGGSWGATLALLHALDEPQAVAALLLRGVFLAREQDLRRFFDAAAWACWQSQDSPLLERLDRILQSGTASQQRELAQHWWRREQSLDDAPAGAEPPLDALLQRYRVQAHYLRHRCWLDAPPLLDRLHGLPPVPLHLLHGTHDRICPIEGAVAVQRQVPAARLRRIDGAGHAPTHPAMVAAMVSALDAFARSGSFDDAGARSG